ncbi:MAG TPA: hypothetical protein VFY16_10100, partial [Gemmatimonadaceae bacterium]|nr:hypothetical protein [Gemmatimonadaceae bacterium]
DSPAAAPNPVDASAPATGTADVRETELMPEEEPVTTGTLFLMVILLMIVAGFWVILYGRLLDR